MGVEQLRENVCGFTLNSKHVSYSLNSLKGVILGIIADYYRGYSGGY